MPELPEVETIVRGLRRAIVGKKIMDLKVREPRIIGFPDKESFVEKVINREIKAVNRRGKYIMIELDHEQIMVIHLRMTGRLLIKPYSEDIARHTHVIFTLDDGNDLRFNNLRKFGRIYLIRKDSLEDAGGLAELGPEPLAEDFTLETFTKLLDKRKAVIKSLLLNQKFIAGLGNIYADEALFKAGISPMRPANTLATVEIKRLYCAIREVLREGIEHGGTTFSDYLNVEGKQGDFQKRLQVYQKTGEPCPECGREIVREKIGGRSSHYCPGCQE